MLTKNRSIYVLRLQHDKFYVGCTQNVLSRISEHVSGFGSEFTKRFKPRDIEEVVHNCDGFDEDKYVIKYMALYGVDNVRGGSYCSLTLEPNVINDIKIRIATATDTCYICCSPLHFARDCPSKQLETDNHRKNPRFIQGNIFKVVSSETSTDDLNIPKTFKRPKQSFEETSLANLSFSGEDSGRKSVWRWRPIHKSSSTEDRLVN